MADKAQNGRQKAQKLLDIYHGSADDFFKFWPADKQYFFSSDGKAFLAYRAQDKVAVCLGDPVGRPSSMGLLLREFKQLCAEHGLITIFIQTNKIYEREYKSIGLHSLLIGSDAVIDLDDFVSDTVHNKYFRNIVNRFEKHGFVFETFDPPHSKQLLADVHAVSASWLKLPHRKEWSFLTGRLDDEYLQQVSLAVIKDSSGKTQAFINQLPSYKPGVASVDLMRHRADAPPNSMDYLFICLLEQLQAEGYDKFNLGMSPLDMPKSKRFMARLVRHGYQVSNTFIGFKGLHQFKAKYNPAWEPRYVWYQGSVLRLVQFGRSIYKLMQNHNQA